MNKKIYKSSIEFQYNKNKALLFSLPSLALLITLCFTMLSLKGNLFIIINIIIVVALLLYSLIPLRLIFNILKQIKNCDKYLITNAFVYYDDGTYKLTYRLMNQTLIVTTSSTLINYLKKTKRKAESELYFIICYDENIPEEIMLIKEIQGKADLIKN